MFFYGIPTLLSLDQRVIGFFWILASIPLFFGLNFVNRLAFEVWGYDKFKNFLTAAVPAAALIYFVSHLLLAPPMPYTDELGLIHWDISYPFDLIFFIICLALTMIPAIFFLTTRAKDKKTQIKKILFAIPFLFGGLGGAMNVIYDTATQQLYWAFIFLFIGFIFLGLIALVDVFAKAK
jgi:hypothetical protein